ncbi:MAG: SDR family NAD(P)-dependent oxidoreductase [Alphaproteobacteria bacterium]
MTKPVAVVVGVGPGLGSAVARRFAAAGFAVAVARRQVAESVGLAEEIGGRVYACDATEQDSVESMFATIDRELGGPQVVVYNAGAYKPGGILEIEAADFERCWRIGCLGGFHVGQAAAKRMVEAAAGTIIFTGATAALRGSAKFVSLAVPKFGLRALAQSMARDLGPRGVHVAHTIIDGQIAGERLSHSTEERGADAVLAPDAIAEAYYQLHAQPRSAWTQELDLRPCMEKF